MYWRKMDTAPRDSTRILVCDSIDDTPYIAWWTDDVYAENGGKGGPCGWFSGRYSNGDRPEMENPAIWMSLPELKITNFE